MKIDVEKLNENHERSNPASDNEKIAEDLEKMIIIFRNELDRCLYAHNIPEYFFKTDPDIKEASAVIDILFADDYTSPTDAKDLITHALCMRAFFHSENRDKASINVLLKAYAATASILFRMVTFAVGLSNRIKTKENIDKRNAGKQSEARKDEVIKAAKTISGKSINHRVCNIYSHLTAQYKDSGETVPKPYGKTKIREIVIDMER